MGRRCGGRKRGQPPGNDMFGKRHASFPRIFRRRWVAASLGERERRWRHLPCAAHYAVVRYCDEAAHEQKLPYLKKHRKQTKRKKWPWMRMNALLKKRPNE